MLTPASYDDVIAWLDDNTRVLDAENVSPDQAVGRVLAASVTAAEDYPGVPRAAVDGYALQARATVGASDYNPLSFSLGGFSTGSASPGSAVAVASGESIPDDSDAVIPGYDADVRGAVIDVYAPVAAGDHIIPAGREARRGDTVAAAGRVLRPADAALLVALGVTPRVVRRPKVGIFPVRSEVPDASGAMIRSLAAWDGAACRMSDPVEVPLSEAVAEGDDDLLLVIGGSGLGGNDACAAALEAAGGLVFRGVAINPGETTTMGRAGARMIMVLPGTPLAALFAYDALAGRAIRRLAGRPEAWPYASRRLILDRKISSGLGLLECCRVRIDGERAEPIAVSDNRTLSTAVRADGFVPVPPNSEGFPEGDEVTVYLYDQRY